jgi:hypothetical protein
MDGEYDMNKEEIRKYINPGQSSPSEKRQRMGDLHQILAEQKAVADAANPRIDPEPELISWRGVLIGILKYVGILVMLLVVEVVIIYFRLFGESNGI